MLTVVVGVAGIVEGAGLHGDDLPLPQLLRFHVGISTPRYRAQNHFVIVVIAKKMDQNQQLMVGVSCSEANKILF